VNLPVLPPIKPMLAKIQQEMPRGDDWIYEPKWDGFRTLAFKDGDEVELRSRNDRPMNRYFPDVEQLLKDKLPERCVLDGEIILPGDDGLDFDGLQLRLHPAASRVKMLSDETPASFVIFDVLAHDDDDLRSAPLSERLETLSELFGTARPKVAREPATRRGPNLYLTPCTDNADIAAEWFDDLEKVHLDGVIAKRLSLPYVEGERVMTKIKHRRTADCVVGGYRAHKQGGVGSLLLGLYDGDDLRYIGHTSSFGKNQRLEIYEKLQELRGENAFSFEGEWGPGGQSRWSQGREQEWFAVSPTLVCEVSYDYVQSGHRFRHAARFLRWRDDKRPDECSFEQLSADV
jgi:ATP-dependent DNA ligase